jgi:hypothetical protein
MSYPAVPQFARMVCTGAFPVPLLLQIIRSVDVKSLY